MEEEFTVYTITELPEDAPMYCHWAEGLHMTIIKNGVVMKLDSKEIQQVVKALPKTIGGKY